MYRNSKIDKIVGSLNSTEKDWSKMDLIVTLDMNKEMYRFDLLTEDQDAAEIEDEAMRIDYMGEDADPEEFGLDGDEEFD